MIKVANGFQPSFTPKLLSGSTNGRGIKITPTGTPGTTVHTAIAGTTSHDKIWLYAINNHSASVVVTIQWGGTTSPDDYIIVTVPFQQGRFLLVDGRQLNNTLLVKVFASVADVIVIEGEVKQYD